MKGSEFRESSATDLVELRRTRLARPSSSFLIGLATKLKCAFCATRPQIWHAIEISLALFLSHTNEQPRFSHFSWKQYSLINANRPDTLLSDYGSHAWEGPLIPLMSLKRQKIIHSNSLDIGWYFNIWSLSLGVYLPTQLAHAQMHTHICTCKQEKPWLSSPLVRSMLSGYLGTGRILLHSLEKQTGRSNRELPKCTVIQLGSLTTKISILIT